MSEEIPSEVGRAALPTQPPALTMSTTWGTFLLPMNRRRLALSRTHYAHAPHDGAALPCDVTRGVAAPADGSYPRAARKSTLRDEKPALPPARPSTLTICPV